MPDSPKLRKFIKLYTGLISLFTILIGVIFLLHWLLFPSSNTPPLIQFYESSGYLFSGLGLLFSFKRRKKLSFICGILITLLAFSLILESFLGINLDSHRYLMEYLHDTDIASSGNIVIISVFAFLLIGLSFILDAIYTQRKLCSLIIRMLGSFVFIIGIISIFGVIIHLETEKGWINYTKIDFFAASGFVFIGSALAFITPLPKNIDYSRQLRYWISTSVSLFLLVICTMLTLTEVNQEVEQKKIMIQEQAKHIEQQIQRRVHELSAQLEFIIYQWESKRHISRSERISSIQDLLKKDIAFDNIALLNKNFQVLYTTRNLSSLQLDILRNLTSQKFEKTHSRSFFISTPKIFEGSPFLFLKIYTHGSLKGYIVSKLNISDIIKKSTPPKYFSKASLTFSIDEQSYSATYNRSTPPTNLSYQSLFDLMGTPCEVNVLMNKDYLFNWSRFSEVFFVSGIIISLLVGFIINYTIKTRQMIVAADTYAAKLNSILDTAPDGIISINSNREIISANRSMCMIFGYTEDELLGQNIEILIPKEYRKNHESFVSNYFDTGSLRIMANGRIVSGLKKNGDEIPLEVGINKTKLPNDETHAVAVIRDISALREVQRRLNQIITELEKSNADLSRFAYVASHDLQEPLRMVINFSSLLQEEYADKLDETANSYINFAVDAASRMQNLITDLLEYSRLGKSRDIQKESTSLDNCLDTALNNLKEALSSCKAKITRSPLPTVLGSEMELSRLFQNLISNAIKYQDSKRLPTVQITAAEEKGSWIISISDNGIGMSKEYLEQIFQPFKRLHSADEYPGTGIGLAICKRLIENLGGSIWVESKLNEGSTFYFKIPKV